MAASYPTSIKSYTTKVDDVDDVDAAHMNSVQEEIVAVQTALGANKSTSLVQVVNTIVSTVSTGSTALPQDNTIPQNTEGDQYMSLAITPKSATNKLIIDVTVIIANSVPNPITCALFQDSTANAIAAVISSAPYASHLPICITFRHYMTSGTTSSTTFKVRAGSSSGTNTFNGSNTAQLFGGVMSSSITITEIKA